MDLRSLPRCAECGWRRPSRAPSCSACLRWLDDDIEAAWRAALRDYDVGADDVPAFAATVAADPRGVAWRVMDAALTHTPCPSCGAALGSGAAIGSGAGLTSGTASGSGTGLTSGTASGSEAGLGSGAGLRSSAGLGSDAGLRSSAGLGSGPVGCGDCDAAHGWRWLAAEQDRPGVPPGNEHAIRVATAVARIPHRFPAHMVPRYAAMLPLLIAGGLPAGGDARAAQRWLDNGGTLEALDSAPSTGAIKDLLRQPRPQ